MLYRPPYDVVYADCPWRFQNWSMAEQAVRGEKWGRANGRSPYPVLTTETLASLPVGDICHRDTLLFMWATYPKLADALQVMEAWGFTYTTTVFTWVKLTRQAYRNYQKWQKKGEAGSLEEILPKLFNAGNGYWTMANPEIVLLGKRKGGKPKRLRKDIRNLVVTPLTTHSAKPQEVRDRIVRLVGDRPRIEMFARPPVADNWDALGDEIDGRDIREALPALAAGTYDVETLDAIISAASDRTDVLRLPPGDGGRDGLWHPGMAAPV
jgi:N6-adenosine-specific RNA methylase IME4